jgi:hypothetical protein
MHKQEQWVRLFSEDAEVPGTVPESKAEPPKPFVPPVTTSHSLGGPQTQPLKHRNVYWARHLKQCKPPEPSSSLPKGRDYKGAVEDVSLWFTRGDVAALHRLKNVGSGFLLAHTGFGEYTRYLQAGAPTVVDPPRPKEGATFFNNKRGDRHAHRVGHCLPKGGKDLEQQHLSPEAEAVFSDMGLSSEMHGWSLPPSSTKALKHSLGAQAARQMPGDWSKLMELPNYRSMIEDFEDKYSFTDCPTLLPLAASVDRYLADLDPTKSSGWSARYLPGTKGNWRADPASLIYLAGCRIALRMSECSAMHHYDGPTMVKLGLRDPEEVFTKKEAHDLAKSESGRWRLIWTSSILDSVVQDYMHHTQNKQDIEDYASGVLHTQAIGMGHHDAGIARLGESFDLIGAGQEVLYDSDASGWDLSVCRDSLYYDAERRVSRFTAAPQHHGVSSDLMYCEAAANSCHVVVMGKELWSFDHFGITASGIPSTSAQNSPIRCLLLILCGAIAGITVGDDEVHSGLVDLALLFSTGVITKGSVHSSSPTGPIEMTSHAYSKVAGVWTARFLGLYKMMAHADLRRVPGEAPPLDSLAGMRFNLRHSPAESVVFDDFLTRMDWPIPQAADTGFAL